MQAFDYHTFFNLPNNLVYTLKYKDIILDFLIDISIVDISINTRCLLAKFKMDNLHGYMAGRIAFTMKHKLHKLFKSKGYNATPEQWGILNLLEEKEGLSQSEIAEETTKDKASITRILDVMQRNSLIQRQKHESDRRAYKIFLTDKGRNLQYTLTQFVQKIDNQACKGLSIDELQELKRILTKMKTNLEK